MQQLLLKLAMRTKIRENSMQSMHVCAVMQIALGAGYKGAPSCHYQSDYGTTRINPFLPLGVDTDTLLNACKFNSTNELNL